MRLTSTAFSDASRCLKLYEYKQVEKLVPKPSLVAPALRRGIWLHACLESYHRTGDWRGTLSGLRDWVVERGVAEQDAENMLADVQEIMLSYAEYWSAEPWTVLLSEEAFEIPLGEHIIAPRNDLIVRDSRGVWLVENKSTSKIPPASWRSVDPQTALQFAAAKASGKFPSLQGIIFNYLLTTKPPVPQVTKGGMISKREIVTTRRAFEQAAVQVRKQWNGHQEELDSYIDREFLRLVNECLWFVRHKVFRPTENVKETLHDAWSTIQAVEAAEREGHYRRSFHPINCQQFCMMSELCCLEYVTGRPSQALRQEAFQIDTGEREGR